MARKLKLYILCIKNLDNTFTKTDKQFRARNTMSAAKKAYRDNKNLLEVYILNPDDKKVYMYKTEQFFTKKKDFQLTRKNN